MSNPRSLYSAENDLNILKQYLKHLDTKQNMKLLHFANDTSAEGNVYRLVYALTSIQTPLTIDGDSQGVKIFSGMEFPKDSNNIGIGFNPDYIANEAVCTNKYKPLLDEIFKGTQLTYTFYPNRPGLFISAWRTSQNKDNVSPQVEPPRTGLR